MKNKITKKEIQVKISDSVSKAISQMEVLDTSKKVRKIIKRASKKIASTISHQLRNAAAKTKKVKPAKTVKAKSKKKSPALVA